MPAKNNMSDKKTNKVKADCYMAMGNKKIIKCF